MKHLPSCLAAALLAVLALAGSAAATEQVNPPSPRRNPIVEAVQKTKHSIVTVRVPRPGGGKDMIGTGVVVDERGYIVTNRHVVGSNRTVTVRLFEGTELTAEVMIADPSWDLAVIRVRAPKQLQALLLAPTED